METIKKGSKGDAVKVLQSLLNITADGIFGANTEAKVKDFQRTHNLTPDGIVGTKTWVALGMKDAASLNSKAVDPCVIYDPLTVHVTKFPNRAIKYIAIHYTAGGSSAAGRAKACKSVFQKRQASADFAIDDRDIVQFNPDLANYYCWSVGDARNTNTGGGRLHGIAYNRNTISIEICSNLKNGGSASHANNDGWYFTEPSLNNAVKLVKILMRKYNVTPDRVVRHYDITGKLCPGIEGWNDYHVVDNNGKKMRLNNSSKWNEFKNKIK